MQIRDIRETGELETGRGEWGVDSISRMMNRGLHVQSLNDEKIIPKHRHIQDCTEGTHTKSYIYARV